MERHTWKPSPSRVVAMVFALTLIVPAAASATTFGNPTPITINDNANATPYPSLIQVSGLSGRVSNVTVTLSSLTHNNTSDIAAVIEAPDGTSMGLMDSAGNSGAIAQTFTFSDSATQFLPSGAALTTGTYKPTSYFGFDSFPSPGPGLTYCQPPLLGTCTLASSFNGHAPNGAWQLYIADFVAGSAGILNTGWSIDIDTDAVAPETTIDSGPAGPTTDNTPTFGFSANEAGSTFECRVDTAAFAACSGPAATHTPAAMADGAHVFEVRATDAVGNLDASPAQRAFTVDTVAPDATIAAAAVAGHDATFGFNATEPATFTCALDGAAPDPCTSPAAYSGLADGTHSLSVVATDTAGNADPTPAVKAVTIATPAAPGDARAPVVAVVALKVNAKGKSAKLTWIAVDDVTAASALTYDCKLDNAAFTECTSPATFKKLKPGAHQVQLRAKDASGNVSSVITKGFKLKKPPK